MVALGSLIVTALYWTRACKRLFTAEHITNIGFAEIADMKTIWKRKAAGVAKKLESKIKVLRIKQSWRSRPRTISAQVAIDQSKNYFNLVVFAINVF
jgi:hypothetical protein